MRQETFRQQCIRLNQTISDNDFTYGLKEYERKEAINKIFPAHPLVSKSKVYCSHCGSEVHVLTQQECPVCHKKWGKAEKVERASRHREREYLCVMTVIEGLQVMRHCANSAASLRHPEWALDMVREGISLYGYPPVETGLPLKPCMAWQAKISYIKEVPAGEDISYGRTFRTDRPTRIATVTCGYGDGYHRSAGGKAEVLIRGKRARILGRICMDQMMADVTEIPEAREEDPVTLMGEDGQERITAEDLARWSGTISYEVLLSCGGRVERKLKTDAGPGK